MERFRLHVRQEAKRGQIWELHMFPNMPSRLPREADAKVMGSSASPETVQWLRIVRPVSASGPGAQPDCGQRLSARHACPLVETRRWHAAGTGVHFRTLSDEAGATHLVPHWPSRNPGGGGVVLVYTLFLWLPPTSRPGCTPNVTDLRAGRREARTGPDWSPEKPCPSDGTDSVRHHRK